MYSVSIDLMLMHVHGAEIDIQYGRSSSFDQVIRSSDIPLEDTKRAAVYRPRRL
jgi:UDP-3-O-acyl-N-acetylglucosamine deacetylase